MKYKVIYESTLKNSRVLTLNEKPSYKEWCKSLIKADGKTYQFHHSTTPGLLAVDTTDTFLNKEIEFV